MQHVLGRLMLADVSHRAFMSKQELSYRVMDLPLVKRMFTDVDVVGFYRRSYVTISSGDDSTIVLSDRTDYSTYAERCSDKTAIDNCKNARAENRLTKDMLKSMNFREFAETVSHKWHNDSDDAAQPAHQRSTRQIMTRDVTSGHCDAANDDTFVSTLCCTQMLLVSTSPSRLTTRRLRRHFSAFQQINANSCMARTWSWCAMYAPRTVSPDLFVRMTLIT